MQRQKERRAGSHFFDRVRLSLLSYIETLGFSLLFEVTHARVTMQRPPASFPPLSGWKGTTYSAFDSSINLLVTKFSCRHQIRSLLVGR